MKSEKKKKKTLRVMSSASAAGQQLKDMWESTGQDFCCEHQGQERSSICSARERKTIVFVWMWMNDPPCPNKP